MPKFYPKELSWYYTNCLADLADTGVRMVLKTIGTVSLVTGMAQMLNLLLERGVGQEDVT